MVDSYMGTYPNQNYNNITNYIDLFRIKAKNNLVPINNNYVTPTYQTNNEYITGVPVNDTVELGKPQESAPTDPMDRVIINNNISNQVPAPVAQTVPAQEAIQTEPVIVEQAAPAQEAIQTEPVIVDQAAPAKEAIQTEPVIVEQAAPAQEAIQTEPVIVEQAAPEPTPPGEMPMIVDIDPNTYNDNYVVPTDQQYSPIPVQEPQPQDMNSPQYYPYPQQPQKQEKSNFFRNLLTVGLAASTILLLFKNRKLGSTITDLKNSVEKIQKDSEKSIQDLKDQLAKLLAKPTVAPPTPPSYSTVHPVYGTKWNVVDYPDFVLRFKEAGSSLSVNDVIDAFRNNNNMFTQPGFFGKLFANNKAKKTPLFNMNDIQPFISNNPNYLGTPAARKKPHSGILTRIFCKDEAIGIMPKQEMNGDYLLGYIDKTDGSHHVIGQLRSKYWKDDTVFPPTEFNFDGNGFYFIDSNKLVA